MTRGSSARKLRALSGERDTLLPLIEIKTLYLREFAHVVPAELSWRSAIVRLRLGMVATQARLCGGSPAPASCITGTRVSQRKG
jgi:hypothetical protein